jgi:GntR family transcriptional regulator/MocR family aminotransferase
MRRTGSGIAPLLPIDRRSPAPLYRQLYEAFRDAILDRRLRAGQRIPSTRSLAVELRISRLPLLTAYEQLAAEGYLESRTGSGTFIASVPAMGRVPARRPTSAPGASGSPPPRARRRVSRDTDSLAAGREPWLGGWGAFRVSEPAVDGFPHDAWSRIVGRHARGQRASPDALRYGDPMGDRGFRQAVADYLRTARAVRCEADQIMAVSGSQQALSLIARVLVEPGSPVWVEEPGYGGARAVLRLRGARLVPVPVDEEGLDVSAGIERCAGAAAAYVTPSHQYPLGSVMSAPRRLRLLDWARTSGAWIVEDDYDSEYRYGTPPIASLQGLDRDSCVLYVGTFSKVLFPALRLGYLVIPEDLVERFAAVRDATDIFPPSLPQAALADFIREGHFARHLRRMRGLYAERRAALVAAIHGELGEVLEPVGDDAGMHLVALFRGRRDDRTAALRAARMGLWAMPLSSCYSRRPARGGFVLGFGGSGPSEISAGVRRLRAALG